MTSLPVNHIVSQAESHRPKLGFPFIAITGSNGKTTTKAMLRQILKRQGRVYDFSPHSDLVTPIARELLTISGAYDWALVKMGAATPFEIKVAARLIRPQIGIITNIGEAHLERHGSIEKIAAAKEALLEAICHGGIAILNRDNEYTRKMGDASSAAVAYFGLSPVADYHASEIEHCGPDGTHFMVHVKNAPGRPLHLPIYSLGDVYNVLAAYAAASELGIDHEVIARALESDFVLPDGRGRLHTIDGLRIFDDTYDATPQSLYKSSKSLLNFRNFSKRLILVMGEMSELGQQTLHMHAMMGHYLAALPIDTVVLVGESTKITAEAIMARRHARHQVVVTMSPAEAFLWLQKNARSGDSILVEGSKTADMAVLVQDLVRLWQKQCPANQPV